MLEVLEDVFGERRVEVVRDVELPLVDAELPAPRLPDRRQDRDRGARAGDDDPLARRDAPQQSGQVGLRFMNAS